MTSLLLVLALLAQASPPQAQPAPPPPAQPVPPPPVAPAPSGAVVQAPAQTVPTLPPSAPSQNIAQWDSNALPPVYERSEQPPVTDDEVRRMSQSGFPPDQIVKILAERQCACDASIEGLVRMRTAGVEPSVINAVSQYALKPNRVLNLEVTLDFTGESQRARNAYLYLFVDDGDQTRVLSANVDELLRRPNAHETTVDSSDYFISHTVRRIVLPGQLNLRTYGRHTLVVASSASPNVSHPSQLRSQDRSAAQVYLFDYPRASLQSLCRLTAAYRRDAKIVDRWRFQGSRFECEWN